MQPNETRKRALVLGGGGVAGVAWELGILMGLYNSGVDVSNADLIIGTSAGSVVGAQISSGTDLETLFTSQLTPVEQTKERRVAFDPIQMMETFRQAVAGAGPDPKAIRARIATYALTVPTVPEAERRAIIETRLPIHMWPQQSLLIVAVDTETGEEYIMDRTTGVSLVDAVSASCAVPGIWPPVSIAGHRYMDGGVRSATNADLAHGYGRILILNPLGANANFLGAGLDAEVAALEREGSQVLVIAPDVASASAISLNPLDPETRQPAALAGRAQGHDHATSVSAFWTLS
jgi:NTE family protein